MKKLLPTLLFALALTASCHRPESADSQTHEEVNSVYYWKTTLSLDSAHRAFLADNDVRRIYLRMFDVTADGGEYGAVPNATIRIPDAEYQTLSRQMTATEIVPVVYITLDGLRAMEDREQALAKSIVKRVHNMVTYNEMPNVSELQLDCDWTPSTEKQFFTLCEKVKEQLEAENLPWRLSSTIRLHQLASDVPPVDAGVLMVYNTGSFNDLQARNSIIDLDDIKPYLNGLRSYPLHLDVAYPTYSWQLLFRDHKFAGITNDLDLTDPAKFERQGENTFRALTDFPHNDSYILEGDLVRQETSDFQVVQSVKAEIEKRLDGRPHSNIIYHLDPENLKNYTSDEIQALFAVGC